MGMISSSASKIGEVQVAACIENEGLVFMALLPVHSQLVLGLKSPSFLLYVDVEEG